MIDFNKFEGYTEEELNYMFNLGVIEQHLTTKLVVVTSSLIH